MEERFNQKNQNQIEGVKLNDNLEQQKSDNKLEQENGSLVRKQSEQKDQTLQCINNDNSQSTKQYFIHDIHNNSGLQPLIIGKCQNYISKTQRQQQRDDDLFEHYPFKQIAKYVRNKSYDNQKQLRTPQFLDKSLQYLKQTFFVTILNDQNKISKIIIGKQQKNKVQEENKLLNNQQNNKEEQENNQKIKRLQKILYIIKKKNEKKNQIKIKQSENVLKQTPYPDKYTKDQNKKKNKPTKVQLFKPLHFKQQSLNQILHKQYDIIESVLPFIQTRTQAIRCQLFAQGIIFPRLTVQLLKCQIFLYILQENQYQNFQTYELLNQQLSLIGLEIILDHSIKDILRRNQSYLKYYIDALTIAIFRVKKKDIEKLIQEHELILENSNLLSYLRLRLQIQRGNYHRYFTYLRDGESVLIKCLLLTHLHYIRCRLCQVIKSGKMDVKKGWLGFLLGLKIKQNQQNEIINLYKDQSFIVQTIKKNGILQKRLQIKNWIRIEQLYEEMIEKINDQ